MTGSLLLGEYPTELVRLFPRQMRTYRPISKIEFNCALWSRNSAVGFAGGDCAVWSRCYSRSRVVGPQVWCTPHPTFSKYQQW